MTSPSSKDIAQLLYDKNVDLENKRRKSAQTKIPSDPNAWQQMRENYEAIILEDHAFSEKHNIEYALWQLHYRRIEEFRAHISASLASSGSAKSQGDKISSRQDRITKIRAQFKIFLSEATGFYHDLTLKIRAKYGLPLSYFSDNSVNQIGMENGGKKSSEIKNGIVSCHQCLIYLGDLARYKGLYGEGESKTRDYAVASSYYLQSASFWPSSGNPHHQLAILASYSADELGAIYRYFRSLAVVFPFSTARDNLIVAFEKNRQCYTQLPVDVKPSVSIDSRPRVTGRGRVNREVKSSDDANSEVGIIGDTPSSVRDTFRIFCIRFVRLNGILFTRTSLETFAEVLPLVSIGLHDLLSSGEEEELNFGEDASHNGLTVLRLISILIFTLHSVNRQHEGQTYAEILQRNVILQNAFVAVFELMDHILTRCAQLRDSLSSYLLPGILVFLEWLACCPDVASGSVLDEKQADVRSGFWSHCVSFFNKLLSNGFISMDEEDDTCFSNMSRYEPGETENRLALWEDFELRGFLPLVPAQTILDFSMKHSFASDVNKEKKARARRALSAWKVLASTVQVGKKTIYFDSEVKKFTVCIESQGLHKVMNESLFGIPPEQKACESGVLQLKTRCYAEGEEDDEEIVFKPAVTENHTNVTDYGQTAYKGLDPTRIVSTANLQFHNSYVSVPFADINQSTILNTNLQAPVSFSNIDPHLPQHSHMKGLSNGMKGISISEGMKGLSNGMKGLNISEGMKGLNISESMKGLNISESMQARKSIMCETGGRSSSTSFPHSIQQPINLNISNIDSAIFSGVNTDSLVVKTSLAFPSTLKNPVSRPIRHLGPPPGFNSIGPPPCFNPTGCPLGFPPGFNLVPPKQVNVPLSENPMMDDYSWLDGYQVPQSLKSSGLNSNIINHASHANSELMSMNNGMRGTIGFPFPGKYVPGFQFQDERQKQLLPRENQNLTPQFGQYQAPSFENGHYFV